MMFRTGVRVLCALAFAGMLLGTAAGQTAGGASSAAAVMGGRVGGLATLRDYRTARVSSEDRAGNADMRHIAPGQSLTLAELEGPGEITHLWTTIATDDPDHLRNVVLRIYWDGNDFPSVEAPIGDFYGLGHAKYYYFSNPVQAMGTDKGMNCFWPMPFAKSARIVATNEGPKPMNAFYYYVDWRKFEKLPDNLGYFHAQYRQDFPCVDKQNYLIMDTEGGRGHFAGVSMSIHTMVAGWWGEGDDIFTVDGETTPSLWGTGSEDYFSGAWCYGETFYTDYFGMPLREKMTHGADNYWNVYRLHLENPVTFKKSLKVEIEHGLAGFDNARPGGNNHHSSVAYWYMDKPVALKGKLAPAAERMSVYTPPPTVPGVYEANRMKWHASPGVELDEQNMQVFSREGRTWSNNDQIHIRKAKKGDTIEFEFEVKERAAGSWVLGMTKAPDYGNASVALDGKTIVESFSGYDGEVIPATIPVGNMDLAPGMHKLAVTVTGKDDQSRGFGVGVDCLKLDKTAAPAQGKDAKPDKKKPGKPAKKTAGKKARRNG